MAIAFLKNENTVWKILSTIDNNIIGKAFPIMFVFFRSNDLIYFHSFFGSND